MFELPITDEHVKAYKEDFNIYHSYEDKKIKRLLQSSYKAIKRQCGDFNIDDSETGAELVFNRARYAYHDSIEFFNENFISLITDFAIENGGVDDESEV